MAGVMVVTSSFRKNLIIELKGSADNKEFPNKSPHISKDPQI